MILAPLSLTDIELVRQWRNDPRALHGLRTQIMLTEEMQREWYLTEVCNRHSKNRYWGVRQQAQPYACISNPPMTLVAQAGITFISWEDRNGEISLITNPVVPNIGEDCFLLVMNHAFNVMNLRTIYAECYACNPAVGFWQKLADRYQGESGMSLEGRRYLNGEYHAGHWFSWSQTRWKG